MIFYSSEVSFFSVFSEVSFFSAFLEDFFDAYADFAPFLFSRVFLSLWFFHITQRGAAMHTDEYEPEISHIIIGNAKLIIELMPYIRDTTSTEPMAIIVVIEVHIVLVKH